MASMQIRETDPERDVAALVELEREVAPYSTLNAASWLQRESTVPERAKLRALVAELDGAVVGEGYAFLTWWLEGPAQVMVSVRDHARRHGIGSALYDAVIAHAESLAPTRITSMFYETPPGAAFAFKRGFREARAEQISSVDPRTITEDPAAEVRPASQVDPHVLWHIDETSALDMPMLEPYEPMSFEEWVPFTIERPLYQAEGSFVAYADGEPAAWSMLAADLESARGVTNYTGTLPEFRGRGLARAAKVASLRWAAASGVTRVSTMSDETNAPMLAINNRLGYKPVGRRVEYVKLALG